MKPENLSLLLQLKLWEERRTSLYAFMRYLMPELMPNWHFDVICSRLERLRYETNQRVIILLPPQIGKSLIVSRFLPAYILGHLPKNKIVLSSYAADLADSFNRDVQRIMDNEKYLELFDTRLNSRHIKTISGQPKRTSNFFETVEHYGYLKTVGVGGSLTGYRADCFIGDTVVFSPLGNKRIDEFRKGDLVYSYNHSTSKVEIDTIVATRELTTNDTVKLQTINGRAIECTRDHRLFDGESYKESSKYQLGEGFVTCVGVCRMLYMQKNNSYTKVRAGKKNKEWTRRNVLLKRVRCNKFTQKMHDMQSTNGKKDIKVLYRMQENSQSKATTIKKLPDMLRGVPTKDAPNHVLLTRLRKPASQSTHAEKGKSSFHAWARVSSNFRQAESVNKGTRRKQMRSMWEVKPRRKVFISTPHRQRQGEQSLFKFNNYVQKLPHYAPQVTRDTVSRIENKSYRSIKVYDIQVEKNHNFFANGILAHNCLIVDDPIKGREQADSHVVQRRVLEWYQSVAETRCSKFANRIIMHTPWSNRDLSFQMIANAATDPNAPEWEVLKFPAIAEGVLHKQDPREEGEVLFESFYGDMDTMMAKKATVGSREWASLYQCNPVPAGGTIIKNEWIQYYDAMPDEDEFDEIIQSWDLRFSRTSDANDYVVGQVWGSIGAEKYLLDHVRGRWSFTESIEQFKRLTEKWPTAHKKIVENKANGPALEDSLRKTIDGIVLREPRGNKEQRLYKCEPVFEAGNVLFPRSCAWKEEVLFELTAFPTAPHDDCVDTCTMALIELMRSESRSYAVVGL